MDAYSVISPKNDANDLNSCMYYYVENVNLGLINPSVEIYELCFQRDLTLFELNKLKKFFKLNNN